MAEISIIPLSEDVHLAKYIAKAVEIVHKSDIEYRLTPMGTVLVGEWDPVMEIIRKCHEAVCENSDRVMTKIKIDDLKEMDKSPEDKINSVEKHLDFEAKK